MRMQRTQADLCGKWPVRLGLGLGLGVVVTEMLMMRGVCQG